MELPPRARRIHQALLLRLGWWGTTSAHAENTQRRMADASDVGNYLRARGEYYPLKNDLGNGLELPPRTRRIPGAILLIRRDRGTTSAHAENTRHPRRAQRWSRNYLRARGEYARRGTRPRKNTELPPRTRRIHMLDAAEIVALGTTSAHAENTFFAPIDAKKTRNYLRARGEYYRLIIKNYNTMELPPRTRRILPALIALCRRLGTTSAHAENTSSMAAALLASRNYLRARGEYLRGGFHCKQPKELPPRTRRIQ